MATDSAVVVDGTPGQVRSWTLRCAVVGAGLAVLVDVAWWAIATTGCEGNDEWGCLGQVLVAWAIGLVLLPIGSAVLLKLLGVPHPILITLIGAIVVWLILGPVASAASTGGLPLWLVLLPGGALVGVVAGLAVNAKGLAWRLGPVAALLALSVIGMWLGRWTTVIEERQELANTEATLWVTDLEGFELTSAYLSDGTPEHLSVTLVGTSEARYEAIYLSVFPSERSLDCPADDAGCTMLSGDTRVRKLGGGYTITLVRDGQTIVIETPPRDIDDTDVETLIENLRVAEPSELVPMRWWR